MLPVTVPLQDMTEAVARSGEEPQTVASLSLDLAALRDRPQKTSPLEGLLPAEPALVVLVSRPKVGKTRLCLNLALAAAAGVPPWRGIEKPFELGNVAIIEAEEPAVDTLRALDSLALQAARDGQWEPRLKLFALDPSLDERAAPLLRLNGDGLILLRHLAKECGLIVLDSLSRLKPPTVEESDNDQMTALLDELQRIACQESCYLLLLHHEGHGDRDDPVSAGRGASCISAVARVIWRLDRVSGQPRWRRLRVRGNSVPENEITFEVTSEDAPVEGMLLYFEPVDPLAGIVLEEVLPAVGGTCNTTDLARAIADCGAEERPSGQAQRKAKTLRDRWKREGRISVTEGPRRSVQIERLS